jgi:hypothetical protein
MSSSGKPTPSNVLLIGRRTHVLQPFQIPAAQDSMEPVAKRKPFKLGTDCFLIFTNPSAEHRSLRNVRLSCDEFPFASTDVATAMTNNNLIATREYC